MNYIAIDFDGTCVTHKYPKIGRDIGAVSVLKELVESGHKLILNTMRSDLPLAEAVKWFEQNNIPLFGINNNPTQKSWTNSPKVYAHIYIDDAALGTPLLYDKESGRNYVDWVAVRALLKQASII